MIKMSFIDNKKQESDPEFVLQIMPELKEDYLKDRPCKLEKDSIEIWKVVSVLNGDCDLPIEQQSFSCTQVLFDKEGEDRYLNLCEQAMQEERSCV